MKRAEEWGSITMEEARELLRELKSLNDTETYLRPHTGFIAVGHKSD